MKYYHLRYPWGSAWTGMMLFCGNKNILIDSAVQGAEEFLKNELAKCGLPVAGIDLVANTHSHSDHCGMNDFLRSAGAEIHRAVPGETIDGGDYTLSVIASPGHSPDSISFLEPESGILFTGDALEGAGTRYAGIALYQNPAALLETISHIRELAENGTIRTLFLGHSYDRTGGVVLQKDILAFLDHCNQTVRNYDDFLRTLPPELPAQEAAEKLRTKFGVTTTPIDPASAVLTVNAHRNFPL